MKYYATINQLSWSMHFTSTLNFSVQGVLFDFIAQNISTTFKISLQDLHPILILPHTVFCNTTVMQNTVFEIDRRLYEINSLKVTQL